MLQSPEANLIKELIAKLKADVPELRFIAQDMMQLENYEIRPSVSWPCALLDFDETKFSDMQNHAEQLADGFLNIRIGHVKYSDVNNLIPDAAMEKALQFLELEYKVAKVLHGFNPAGMGKLLRRGSGTEKRDDDIRVRVVRFAFGYTDSVGKKNKTLIARPGATLGITKP